MLSAIETLTLSEEEILERIKGIDFDDMPIILRSYLENMGKVEFDYSLSNTIVEKLTHTARTCPFMTEHGCIKLA